MNIRQIIILLIGIICIIGITNKIITNNINKLKVTQINNFLSKKECKHIINNVKTFKSSTVISKNHTISSGRTSSTHMFKKSDELRDVFKNIPDNKILVETDSPYLSPEPLRGKVNQPSHIIHTIKKLSEIRNISYNETVNLTKINFLNLFNKVPTN